MTSTQLGNKLDWSISHGAFLHVDNTTRVVICYFVIKAIVTNVMAYHNRNIACIAMIHAIWHQKGITLKRIKIRTALKTMPIHI